MNATPPDFSPAAILWTQWYNERLADAIAKAAPEPIVHETAEIGNAHNAPFFLATMQGYLIGISGRRQPANPYDNTPLGNAWLEGISQGREHRAKELETREPPDAFTINKIAAAQIRANLEQ